MAAPEFLGFSISCSIKGGTCKMAWLSELAFSEQFMILDYQPPLVFWSDQVRDPEGQRDQSPYAHATDLNR